MRLNFSQVTKSFAELFSRDVPAILKFFDFFPRIYLKQLPLIPKSIFTGEYQQHQYTCFFILAFHIQLNMLYICANEIYISNRCISSMIISAILQYFLKWCWNSQETKSTYLRAPNFGAFWQPRGHLGAFIMLFESKYI